MKPENKSVATVSAPVTEAKASVVKSPEQVARFITFDEAGRASWLAGAGSNVTALDHIEYMSDGIGKHRSQSVRLCSALLLAKQLPPVKVAVGGGENKLAVREKDAFEFVCEKLAERCASDSTYQNIKGLIPVLELQDKNPELRATNEFTLKNALGYMKEKGALKDNGKVVLSKLGTIGKMLKEGVSQAKVTQAIKDARPSKSNGKGKDAEKAKSETAKAEVKAAADTDEALARDLEQFVLRFEKRLVAAKDKHAATRAAVRPFADTLHKLAHAGEGK